MLKSVAIYLIYSFLIATTLTLCDYFCHTRLNVLYYHHPNEGISLFPNHPTGIIFRNFFGIGLYCVVSSWFVFHQMKPLSTAFTIMLFSIFTTFYYLSGLLQDYPMFLNNLFLVVWAINLTYCDRDANKLLLYSVFLGVLGPVVEGYYSGEVGFFAYNDVDAYFVPCWLCGLYLNGALALAAMTSKIEAWRVGKASDSHNEQGKMKRK